MTVKDLALNAATAHHRRYAVRVAAVLFGMYAFVALYVRMTMMHQQTTARPVFTAPLAANMSVSNFGDEVLEQEWEWARDTSIVYTWVV